MNHIDTGLRLSALRGANLARLPTFRNSHGNLAHSKADGSDWSPAQWLQAVTGELGEYANVRKKFERGDLSAEEFRKLASKELADVQTYLDLLALQVDVDLSQATIDKFNEVSERVKSPIRLDANGWYEVLEATIEERPIQWPPMAIKLGADAQPLPDSRKDHVAVKYPDIGLVISCSLLEASSWQHAKSIAAEYRLFGHSDWSCGTPQEQLLAVDYSRYQPAMNLDLYPNTPSSGRIWTRLEDPSSPSDLALCVSLGYGYVGCDYQCNSGLVRPVRRVAAGQ